MPRPVTHPFHFYGAKGNLAPWLLSLLPTAHECYVEPFCGGASLLFAKPPSPVEVLNDADGAIVSFFRVLRDPRHAKRLRELLELTPYARLEWEECRAGWRQTTDEVELARRWYTAIWQSFSGHLHNSGWSFSRNAEKSSAATFRAAIDALPRFAKRLARVQIDYGDFEEVIRRYDGPETVFYCDPPYPLEVRTTSDRRYTVEMSMADHRRLLKLLTRESLSGMVLLSGYEGSELYDRTLSAADWTCVRREQLVCASSRTTRKTRHTAKGTRTECVWLNPAAQRRQGATTLWGADSPAAAPIPDPDTTESEISA